MMDISAIGPKRVKPFTFTKRDFNFDELTKCAHFQSSFNNTLSVCSIFSYGLCKAVQALLKGDLVNVTVNQNNTSFLHLSL